MQSNVRPHLDTMTNTIQAAGSRDRNVEKEAMAWSLRDGLQIAGCRWRDVLSGLVWAVVWENSNRPKMRSHRQVCAMPVPNDTHFEGGRDV